MSESNLSSMSKYFIYYYNCDFCGSLSDRETFAKIPKVSWASFKRYKRQLLAAREEDPEGYADEYLHYSAPPNHKKEEEEMMEEMLLLIFRSMTNDKKKKIIEYMENMV